ncbi:MAG: hypothetical protein KatS3mg123_2693 [Burkholderiales bacterium]|nr:MAG: hypothetical protein KatS3mg123_2693 [Burkholderiales bacterium]
MSPTIKRALRFVASRMDGMLLTATALLLATGLITLYSASGASLARVMGQLTNLGVALAAMWAWRWCRPSG